MSVGSRPFAYNTGGAIPGTIQVGDLAVGTPTHGFPATGLNWWNGPSESGPGWIIAKPVPSNTQPTPVFDGTMSLSTNYKGVNIVLSNSNQTAYQQFGYQMSVLANTFINNNDKNNNI